jgi:putative (di)nucleoside polyphosphate hydrolase
MDEYRPCVGIVVFNKAGQVFIGHRNNAIGEYVWQFPQGGIDDGENPADAALRELQEETGIVSTLVTPLGQIDDWLFYDFPTDFKHSEKARGKRGQRQRWFAYRFNGHDEQIDLFADDHVEFSAWRWGTLDDAHQLIVPFKRKIYERLACEFAGFANPK